MVFTMGLYVTGWTMMYYCYENVNLLVAKKAMGCGPFFNIQWGDFMMVFFFSKSYKIYPIAYPRVFCEFKDWWYSTFSHCSAVCNMGLCCDCTLCSSVYWLFKPYQDFCAKACVKGKNMTSHRYFKLIGYICDSLLNTKCIENIYTSME